MAKGRSHRLLRKALIKHEKDKKAETLLKDKQMLKLIPSLREEIEELKHMLIEKDRKIEEYSEDTDILKRLYEDGIIDINGDPIQR